MQVRYRETITEPAERHEYTHKKQSGGHGQFARVRHPASSRSSGARASSSSTRSSAAPIGKGYIPAVAKGIEEAMARGGPVRLPGGRRAGHARRRQGAQRRQRRDGVQDRRPRWRSGRRSPRPARWCSSRSPQLDVTVPDRPAGRRDGRPQRPPRPGAGHRAGRRGEQAITALVPQSRAAAATPSTCARSPAGGAGSRAEHDHYDAMPSTARPPTSSRAGPGRGRLRRRRPLRRVRVRVRVRGRGVDPRPAAHARPPLRRAAHPLPARRGRRRRSLRAHPVDGALVGPRVRLPHPRRAARSSRGAGRADAGRGPARRFELMRPTSGVLERGLQRAGSGRGRPTRSPRTPTRAGRRPSRA